MAPVPMVEPIFAGFLAWNNEIAKASDYAILAGYNGSLFTNAGASGTVVFTLPAIQPNLRFGFYVVADYRVDIRVPTADLGKVVAFNSASADGVSFQTAGQSLGGGMILQSNLAGTLWYAFNMSAGAHTITVLTGLS